MPLLATSLDRVLRPAACSPSLLTVCLVIFLGLPYGAALKASTPLRGSLGAHDPGTIVKCKDRYYLFATGRGISSKWSSNRVYWASGPRVFTNAPAWTTNTVPGFDGNFWAPDIGYFNGQYRLYYSISTWGSQVSAIALVTNPTLDPSDPAYRWTDQGIVIQSQVGSPYNTIDPCVVTNAAGNPWLVFGSYWNGIYLVQLDPATGLRIAPNSPAYRLAYNSSIEASCIHYRAPYYYLFVNWGSCCVGVNSTYNIRMGRSSSITGPYLDRNGVDLANNGGSLFLEGTGKFVGPGHVGVLSEGGLDWFSYHYYDAGAYAPWYGAFGAANFDLEPLSWSADGWPAFTNDWSAVYDFQDDARDQNGQYYGLLRGGAAIQNDAVRGRVLSLNGTNQFVQLPPGVAYARTISAVVRWLGGGAWQRVFDFGTDTSRYLMLTPLSGSGKAQFDIKAGGAVQNILSPSALPAGVWVQVAVTLDGARGVLYVNGSPVATNTSMNLSPLDVRAQTNFLGRSKFGADPFFKGQIANFTAYGRVLSAAEIAAPRPVIEKPTQTSSAPPGASVSFAGSARDLLRAPLDATRLAWTVEYVDSQSTNVILGPLSGVADGSFTVPTNAAAPGKCVVRLVAMDGSGRRGTNSVEVAVSANPQAAAPWSSFYPFTADARDASNRFHGGMLGGASIQLDPNRGPVLNLAGGSQYVGLPAGVSTLATFAGWVKWRGGAPWQRIFDFGEGTSRFFFLTPLNSDGRMQCAITAEAGEYTQVIEADPLVTNAWAHVAVVLDGRQGVLLLNGQAVAVNNSVNLSPADIGATRNYFGKSQFAADANFNGQLDSVWLGSEALTLDDILHGFFQPRLTATLAGNSFRLSWPDWAGPLRLYSSPDMDAGNWAFNATTLTASNGFLTAMIPLSSARQFFRLQWP
jgi:arabinan endo-1,5-alpha-L-arabinosidase